MTKKLATAILRNICKQYKVKVIFKNKLKNHNGTVVHGLHYPGHKKVIHINSSIPIKYIASAVFHELGHVYCIEYGIWSRFHSEKVSSLMAFRVENWIEWWAKNEWDRMGMRKLFGYYSFSYCKADKKKLLEWFEENA